MRLSYFLPFLVSFEIINVGLCFVSRQATGKAVFGTSDEGSDRIALPCKSLLPFNTCLYTAGSSYIKTTNISDEIVEKFQTLRKAFPKNANIVKAGGWYNLERLSVDPKQELVGMIVEGLKSTDESKVQFGSTYTNYEEEKLEALLLLLFGMAKGFDSDTIDGEWDLVFTRQGKKSPAFQKLVGTTEKAGRSKNFFDVATMTFSGIVRFWRWGRISTKVKVSMR